MNSSFIFGVIVVYKIGGMYIMSRNVVGIDIWGIKSLKNCIEGVIRVYGILVRRDDWVWGG